MIKSYQELIQFMTFEERFNYLKIGGRFGRETLGWRRYFQNQFYHSREWKRIRQEALIRDNGCDLAILDREIYVQATVHHINPIDLEDIEHGAGRIFDLNNLITVSPETHRAIHIGNESLLVRLPKERTKGDMCPWLQQPM